MGETEIFRISLEIWQVLGDPSPRKETDTEQFWIYKVCHCYVYFGEINGDLTWHTDSCFFLNLYLLL